MEGIQVGRSTEAKWKVYKLAVPCDSPVLGGYEPSNLKYGKNNLISFRLCCPSRLDTHMSQHNVDNKNVAALESQCIRRSACTSAVPSVVPSAVPRETADLSASLNQLQHLAACPALYRRHIHNAPLKVLLMPAVRPTDKMRNGLLQAHFDWGSETCIVFAESPLLGALC